MTSSPLKVAKPADEKAMTQLHNDVLTTASGLRLTLCRQPRYQ
jgi:hypothetical protein